jgi:hypothetical protein
MNKEERLKSIDAELYRLQAIYREIKGNEFENDQMHDEESEEYLNAWGFSNPFQKQDNNKHYDKFVKCILNPVIKTWFKDPNPRNLNLDDAMRNFKLEGTLTFGKPTFIISLEGLMTINEERVEGKIFIVMYVSGNSATYTVVHQQGSSQIIQLKGSKQKSIWKNIEKEDHDFDRKVKDLTTEFELILQKAKLNVPTIRPEPLKE